MPQLEVDLIHRTAHGGFDAGHIQLGFDGGQSTFQAFFLVFGIEVLDLGADVLFPEVGLFGVELFSKVQLALDFFDALQQNGLVQFSQDLTFGDLLSFFDFDVTNNPHAFGCYFNALAGIHGALDFNPGAEGALFQRQCLDHFGFGIGSRIVRGFGAALAEFFLQLLDFGSNAGLFGLQFLESAGGVLGFLFAARCQEAGGDPQGEGQHQEV